MKKVVSFHGENVPHCALKAAKEIYRDTFYVRVS